jgi:hypothetical protein
VIDHSRFHGVLVECPQDITSRRERLRLSLCPSSFGKNDMQAFIMSNFSLGEYALVGFAGFWGVVGLGIIVTGGYF